MKIGVLAVQGDFELHQKMLDKLGIENIAVRTPEQLKECDGLIIPGGESTTFIKLLKENHLDAAIEEFGKTRKIMGTCAGLITLSRHVQNYKMETLNLIDAEVARNAYGRQIDSFVDEIELNLNGKVKRFEGVFIRAPKIEKMGEGVRALAFHNDEIVMAENENIIIATFHPELTDDTYIHEYFTKKIAGKA